MLGGRLAQHHAVLLPDVRDDRLIQVVAAEFGDYGLQPLLRKYRDNIQPVVSGHLHKWIDFAHTYGPQHYVMAAIRYDPNAFMLMEIDSKRATWRFINADLVSSPQNDAQCGHMGAPIIDRGIVVRNCGSFEGLDESCLRVAVRMRSENQCLAQALASVQQGSRSEIPDL